MTAIPDTPNDNPTRLSIASAIEGGLHDVKLDTNPALKALGATLVTAQVGEVVMSFEAGDATVQGNDVVSGGVIANMLDTAMAIATLSRLEAGMVCATVSLSVNMMSAAQPGTLYAVAKIDRLGQRMCFAQAQLFDTDQRLIAGGTSSLMILKAEGL